MVEFIKEKLQECFSSLQYPLSPNFDDILEIFLCFGTQANRKCFFQCLSWWSTVGLNIFVSVSFCMLIYLSLLSLSVIFLDSSDYRMIKGLMEYCRPISFYYTKVE